MIDYRYTKGVEKLAGIRPYKDLTGQKKGMILIEAALAPVYLNNPGYGPLS